MNLATDNLGLSGGLARLGAAERRVIEHLLGHRRISRDVNREMEDARTLGERVADRIAAFGGSWTFITIFMVVLIGWVGLNTFALGRHTRPFDPYPYILLNLFLSMVAALQAPIIMMSQNRQAARDRLEATHDYEVNLLSEVEIRTLHEKLDRLREQDWANLVALQQEQMRMLERLLARAGGQRDGEG